MDSPHYMGSVGFFLLGCVLYHLTHSPAGTRLLYDISQALATYANSVKQAFDTYSETE